MSQPDALSSSSEKPSEQPSSTHSRGGRLRRYILFALLLVMLGALWYDRKVARPSVESAYDRIERLNEGINAEKSRKQLTSKEVQTALNTMPDRVFAENGYQVEVYSWFAGLPFKTRDYYAVYSSAPPNRFLKHYKFELPKDELSGDAALSSPPKTAVSADQSSPITEIGLTPQ